MKMQRTILSLRILKRTNLSRKTSFRDMIVTMKRLGKKDKTAGKTAQVTKKTQKTSRRERHKEQKFGTM